MCLTETTSVRLNELRNELPALWWHFEGNDNAFSFCLVFPRRFHQPNLRIWTSSDDLDSAARKALAEWEQHPLREEIIFENLCDKAFVA